MKKFNIKLEDVYKRLDVYKNLESTLTKKGFNINAIIALIIAFFIVFELVYGPKILILELMKDASWISGFLISLEHTYYYAR